jgi:hypothetical protein
MTETNPIYGDDVVDTYWPYDGPHDDDHTIQAGRAIGRLVRYLNNATGPGHRESALPYAPTAYHAISGVAHAVGLLPQLLDQLAGFLDEQADDPTLYDDRHGEWAANDTAIAAADWLRDAVRHAHALGSSLSNAGRHAGHLGNEEA